MFFIPFFVHKSPTRVQDFAQVILRVSVSWICAPRTNDHDLESVSPDSQFFADIMFLEFTVVGRSSHDIPFFCFTPCSFLLHLIILSCTHPWLKILERETSMHSSMNMFLRGSANRSWTYVHHRLLSKFSKCSRLQAGIESCSAR